MTDKEKDLKLGEMDGYNEENFPHYLTDFDAIIPLIQKQDKATLTKLVLAMKGQNDVSRMVDWLKMSPRELSELLLKVKQ